MLLVKKTFSSQDNQDTDDHRDEQDRVAVARVVVCPLPSRLVQELLPHIVAQWSGRWHFSPSWLCSLLFLSILVAVVGSSLEDQGRGGVCGRGKERRPESTSTTIRRGWHKGWCRKEKAKSPRNSQAKRDECERAWHENCVCPWRGGG